MHETPVEDDISDSHLAHRNEREAPGAQPKNEIEVDDVDVKVDDVEINHVEMYARGENDDVTVEISEVGPE